MSIESVIPSNYLILWHPLLLLPSIFPNIRVFSNESALCIRWPKYWSFSFNISPSNEYPGLISFRIGLVGSPCSPRDSQESSPTPQFKSISSLALSFLYSSTLTSIHDYWKNHSFEDTGHPLSWENGPLGDSEQEAMWLTLQTTVLPASLTQWGLRRIVRKSTCMIKMTQSRPLLEKVEK